MNGSPYRTPQPSDRRIINRSGSEQPQRQQPQEELTREEPTPQRASSSRAPESKPKKSSPLKGILITLGTLLILGASVFAIWGFVTAQPETTGIDTSKYQAIFLTNGQAYLGKLEELNSESFRITQVYLADSPQASEEDITNTEEEAENSISLVPITGSVHGPEDEMIIMKEQVLFYENLREDSQAARLIEQNAR